MIEHDERLAGVLRRSLVVRLPLAVIDRAASASRDSKISSSLRTAITATLPAGAGERLRLAAATIACAAIAQLAIRSLLSPYAVSALPWWWSVPAALGALSIAAVAPAIAAAWRSSAASRLMSWLTGD